MKAMIERIEEINIKNHGTNKMTNYLNMLRCLFRCAFYSVRNKPNKNLANYSCIYTLTLKHEMVSNRKTVPAMTVNNGISRPLP